jgi:hypothetical protein
MRDRFSTDIASYATPYNISYTRTCIGTTAYTVYASMPIFASAAQSSITLALIYQIPMFHIVNPETMWTTNTFSSRFTIAKIVFITANHVEMIRQQTLHKFAIYAGLFS